jgi:Holliday junction resolvasome RuvABC endonuclease subunit
MKILGLDVSSVRTGHCIINNGRLVKSSCGCLEPPTRKPYGERLYSFEVLLRDLIRKHKPDEVIIEDIFKGRSMLTFKSLAMFRAIALKVTFEELGKDPISVMASAARALIGVKNKKEIAYEFIVKKYKLTDYEFDTHNDICDAIVLALTAYMMKKQGIDAKSIRNLGRKKRRKRKRNKKGV